MLLIALVLVLSFISAQTIAQNAGDYRSNTLAGEWALAANWQRFNGTMWVAAGAAPTSADGVVTIRNGHRINLTAAATIDQVVVATGGELYIYNPFTPIVFTLANGAGNDIEVNGLLVVSANATLVGAGNIVNNSGGTFIVRNFGILSVTTVNNGTMQVANNATFQSNTVTNNATFNMQSFTLNLNTATLVNHGTITFDSILDSFIDSSGGGIFNNEPDGTLYKTSALGAAWIDPDPGTVSFNNRGIVKGIGPFIFRNAANTGVISPGNNGAGILEVNPTFITGKSPAFHLDIISSGVIPGLNYDQAVASNFDAATVNISQSTLTMTDNGNDGVGTIYTIFTSTSTINGTFATVHLPPTLGLLTYGTNTITVQKIATQNRYVWSGGNADWTVAANWTPARTTPAATDILTFNTGTTLTITNVPTQSIAALNITNNTTVNLQASGTSKNLTVGSGFMNHVNVDPGSTLNVLNNSGIVLNIFVAAGSRAVIGGVVNMQNGTFNIGDNVLLLHTTAVPLLRTSGQFAIGAAGSIQFGDVLHTAGPTITLTASIFIGPPVISSLTVCRVNGAVFGNQSITVNTANMILGNLTTNATGRLFFSITATPPVEIPSSKIIGYAEMLTRTIGTAALNFLGANCPAGSNIGAVAIVRVTGADGINVFNGFNSIASTWVITASVEPSPARSITFTWFSEFDNVANTALQFQDYRYDVGPGWVAVGALASLQSTGNPRVTTAVITLKLSGSWSISDQANILPIVLGSLEGKQVDNTIELDWETLSELHSDYFEIQRRGEFEEGFNVLGTVNAHGTSNSLKRYSFTDEQPAKGVNYYRLKLVDTDQTFEYSPVIAITFDGEAEFMIYPNPTTGKEVTVHFAEAVNGQLSIFDMAQRKIRSQVLSGTPVDEVVISDLSLSPGAYIITFESRGKRMTRKLVVRP